MLLEIYKNTAKDKKTTRDLSASIPRLPPHSYPVKSLSVSGSKGTGEESNN